jgi:NAD-dependent DNA ligase
MTGFRDSVLQEKLKTLGVNIGSTVSSKTFVLLVKDPKEDSGKIRDAKKYSIPIMIVDDFVKKYRLNE